MTIATETLTIRLPTAAAHRLRRVAEVARRPVGEVVAETLRASLPPLLEDVPPAFRSDLAALETFSTAALWQQMRAELSPDQVDRYDGLLEANAAGSLNATDHQEMASLCAEADRLMFRKAYAALLLKWRGEHIPTLLKLESAV